MTDLNNYTEITENLRMPMLRFARLHLQRREDAEDAVQEVFLALLQIDMNSLNQVGVKRYLFGVLKNKVVDILRKKYRSEINYEEAFSDDFDDLLFLNSGHWADGVSPPPWADPEGQLHTEQFFKIVDICVNQLPAKPARVFSMKEFLECSSDEICTTLGLSQTDYWKCMSRARKQIQLCLHQNWYA